MIDQKEPDPPDGWEDPDYRWMDYYMSDHIVDANKTDTPRTDEAEANAMRSGIPVSMVSRSIERELNHARDWIRKHAPMEDGFLHRCYCNCEECREWRKAAGLDGGQ